jgi:hypothetical protein
MKDIYNISLSDISIEEYQKALKSSELLPGRRILQANIDENFKMLKSIGIRNLEELLNLITTDVKRKCISKKVGIDENYLTILRREINGSIPKPIQLTAFSCIEKSLLLKLLKIGIKTSKDLYAKAISKANRKALSELSGVEYEYILMLVKLSDLGRVNGVGPIFAQMLYDVECDTIEKLSKFDEKELYKLLLNINEKGKYTKAKFTEKDLLFCIKFAQKLPHSIQYDKNE